jgi:hypothetical protein
LESGRLVRIQIEGKSFDVPAGEVLLACVQYIVRAEVPVLGRFCWSNECGNCEISVARADALLPTRERGCQTVVEERMRLTDLSPELRYWLHRRLG